MKTCRANPCPWSRMLILGLFAIPWSASASVYTVNYTGVVDFVYLYGGVPAPDGVVDGATVSGGFTFDTRSAGSPRFEFASCSGWCGGDAVTAHFAYPGSLAQAVTIAGNTWTADLGEVFLLDSYLDPLRHTQSVGVDSGLNGIDGLLNLAVSRTVDPATLFPDVNTLDIIGFDRATSGSGWIRNSDYYVSYRFDTPVTVTVTASVPEPGVVALFSLGLLGLGRKRGQTSGIPEYRGTPFAENGFFAMMKPA